MVKPYKLATLLYCFNERYRARPSAFRTDHGYHERTR